MQSQLFWHCDCPLSTHAGYSGVDISPGLPPRGGRETTRGVGYLTCGRSRSRKRDGVHLFHEPLKCTWLEDWRWDLALQHNKTLTAASGLASPSCYTKAVHGEYRVAVPHLWSPNTEDSAMGEMLGR